MTTDDRATATGAATIEQVAELLYRLRLNNKQPWGFAPEWQRNLYRDHARAVIRWAAAVDSATLAAAAASAQEDGR